VVDDMPDILCGPIFEHLSVCHRERGLILKEAEETLRIFYKNGRGDPVSQGERAKWLRQLETKVSTGLSWLEKSAYSTGRLGRQA